MNAETDIASCTCYGERDRVNPGKAAIRLQPRNDVHLGHPTVQACSTRRQLYLNRGDRCAQLNSIQCLSVQSATLPSPSTMHPSMSYEDMSVVTSRTCEGAQSASPNCPRPRVVSYACRSRVCCPVSSPAEKAYPLCLRMRCTCRTLRTAFWNCSIRGR